MGRKSKVKDTATAKAPDTVDVPDVEEKKVEAPPAVEEKQALDTVKAMISTDAGPFFKGMKLEKGTTITLPADLFATLEKRGWAVREQA